MNFRLKHFAFSGTLFALAAASAAQVSEPAIRARLFSSPLNHADSAYAEPQSAAVARAIELPDAPSASYSTSKDHGNLHSSVTMLSEANWRPLTTKEKFKSTRDDLLNPFTEMSLLAGARFSQAINDRPYLGPGTAGYFRRYGLDTADIANVDFIQGSLLPWMFHEDPRYIPLDEGTRKHRAFYAVSRAVISRKDSGRDGFSKSEVLGAFASSGISNLYYPGDDRDNGLGATSIRAVSNVGTNAAINVLKEFWPDVAHKVKLNTWISSLIEKTLRTTTKSD
jgi:hypothetical protein